MLLSFQLTELANLGVHVRRNEIRSMPRHINSNQLRDLNLKLETLKLLKETHGNT